MGGLFGTSCHQFDCDGNDPGCNVALLYLQFLQPPVHATHVYALNGPELITMPILDDGSLSSPSNFATGASSSYIAVSPSGDRLYTSSNSAAGTYSFSLSNPGSPSLLQGPAVATPLQEIVMTSDGKFLLGSFNAGAQVNSYTADNGGALSIVSGSPFGYACDGRLAISPNGKFLASAKTSFPSLGVKVFGVTTSGTLSAATVNPPTTSMGFASFDNAGGLNFATFSGGNLIINSFDFDIETGSATPISGSPFTLGFGLANFSISDFATTPGGQYAYIAGIDGLSITSQVRMIKIDRSTGTVSLGAPFGSANSPSSVAISPSGEYLYVSGNNSAGAGIVYSYRINSDGSVSNTGTTTTTGANVTRVKLRSARF